MKCDIIIPIWNQFSYTRDCLGHILKNTKYPYRMILVDNASDDETKDYLCNFAAEHKDKTLLIRNEENLGYIKAINQGLKASSAEYVCMMNNDTLPSPGWLERMVDFAVTHPDVGLINPQCQGHSGDTVDSHAEMLARNKGEYMEMNQCQGFCMLVKRELIDKVGFLDEAFGVGGYDDTDYSIRAHKAGYRCVSIRDAYVFHRIHASFDKAGNREEVVDRNRKIYYEKWGKHLRIGVMISLSHPDTAKITGLAEYIYGLAREWAWVHVWINSTEDAKVIDKLLNGAMKDRDLSPHQNIRVDYFNLPRLLFDLIISGKIVERIRRRMKDKRFDAIISFDDAAYFMTGCAARLMKASYAKHPLCQEQCDGISEGRKSAIVIKEGRDGK